MENININEKNEVFIENFNRKQIEVEIVNKLNDFIFKLPTFSDEDLNTIHENLIALLKIPSSDNDGLEEYDRPLILRKNLWVDEETMKTLFLGYTVKTLYLQKEKEER